MLQHFSDPHLALQVMSTCIQQETAITQTHSNNPIRVGLWQVENDQLDT